MVSRLDSLIQTQKKLLNSVSHELRSPLARINISLALLRDRASGDSDDLFQRLDRDVVRIDLLMGQLLTLSRLESGFSSGEREDLHFAQLVEEVAADANFEAQALGKSVSLQTNGSILLRAPIPMLGEALVKTLFATQSASHGPEAMYRSFCTSIGALLIRWQFFPCGTMALGFRRTLQAIFQPFYRVNGDGETMGGNGLGLAIASEAIRLHRGTIRAANLRPNGLEIIIQLPFAYDATSPV